MAAVTFTLRELLDDHVKPIAEAIGAGVPYSIFVGALAAGLSKKIRIPIPEAEEAGKAVAEALAPIDPANALRDIANAVSEAEKAFNSQNLAVRTGRVNVQLMVKVGEMAGAQASFDLAIGPTPQG